MKASLWLVCAVLLAAVSSYGQDTFGGGRSGGGSATNAAGSTGNIQYKAASGAFAGASGINIDNNTNVMAAGFLYGQDLLVTNGILKSGNIVYVDAVNGSDANGARGKADKPFLLLTNAYNAAQAGDTIWVRPGSYIVPTNTTSLIGKAFLNWYFDPGTTVYFGNSADGTTRALFSDTADGAGGGGLGGIENTNYILGYANFVSSNQNSHFVYMASNNSKIYIECNNLYRTHTGSGYACIYHKSGVLVGNIRDSIKNDGYDGYWHAAGNASVLLRAARISVKDTPIEVNEDFRAPGNYFDIGVIERSAAYGLSATFFQIGGNCTYRIGTVNINDGQGQIFAAAPFAGATPGVLMTPLIKVTATNFNSPVLIDNPIRIVGATFTGMTNYPLDLWTNIYLENCTIESPASAPYSISSTLSVGATAFVSGTLNISKPIDPLISVRGIAITTNYIAIAEAGANPPTAHTNTVSLFAKDNANHSDLYFINDIGTVVGPLGSGGSGTPGGADTQLQYNNGGAFDGASGIVVPASSGETNLNITGVERNYRTISTNGIQSQGWLTVTGSQTNTAAAYFGQLNVSGQLNANNGLAVTGSATADDITTAALSVTGTANMGAARTTNSLTNLGWVDTTGSQTNRGGIFALGTNNAAIRLQGTNTGWAELTVPSSGQSNQFRFDVAGMTANQVLSAYSVTVLAGTNLIVITNATGGSGSIDDTAFAASWNGVTTTGPSKNAVYDWGHIFDTDDDGKVNVLDQGVGIAITDSSGILQTPITTSALMASAIGDETGSGAMVFANGAALGTYGSSTNANLNTVNLTNQVIYAQNQYSGVPATEQVDFTLKTIEAMTNTLGANVTYQLTNLTVGTSKVLPIYANAAGTNFTCAFTIPSPAGGTIYWTSPTNGANAFTANSNAIYYVSMYCDRSSNVVASWTTTSPQPIRGAASMVAVGSSATNAFVGGTFYVENTGYTNKAGDAALTNAAAVVIKAHSLTNQFDQVEVWTSGESQSATATTNEIKILYGSETVLDSGLQFQSNSAWRVQLTLTRTGNTAQHAIATLWWGSGSYTVTNATTTLAQTNGIDTTLQVQLASRKPGGITNDFIHAKYWPGPR